MPRSRGGALRAEALGDPGTAGAPLRSSQMRSLNPIINRAFDLAYYGRFKSFSELRAQLAAEGFNSTVVNECFGTFLERHALIRALEGRRSDEPPFHWIAK